MSKTLQGKIRNNLGPISTQNGYYLSSFCDDCVYIGLVFDYDVLKLKKELLYLYFGRLLFRLACRKYSRIDFSSALLNQLGRLELYKEYNCPF